MYRFRKNLNTKKGLLRGFTLLEIMAAVAILAVICTTVMVVLNRCMLETINSELKMQAFEAARENMEKLLGETSVSEMVAFGVLEENPEIDWQMVVEPFREPVTSKMWIRAVCTASYKDSTGERREFELRHWITDLSSKQVKQILDQQDRERAFIEETGENPFGNDPSGLLRWAHHLAETGDFAAAADVVEQIKTVHPESEEAQQVENVQEHWQEEAKKELNELDNINESDEPGKTNKPYDPDKPPDFFALYKAGKITVDEIIAIIFEDDE